MSKFDPVTMDLADEDPHYPSALIPFTFSSHGQELIGRFLLAPGKEPKPVAIVLHGFPGNEPNFDIAHALKRAGWNALVFHYRGAWGSRGDFSFSNAIEDVLSAIAFVNSERARTEFRCDARKLVLIGHSMGGFLGLHAAAKDRRVSGVAALAAFNFGAFGKWIRDHSQRLSDAKQMLGRNLLAIRGTDADQLVEDIVRNREAWDLESLAERLRETPLLVAYGNRDSVSTPELHHHSLMKALAEERTASLQEKEFTADHMFSDCRIGLTRDVLAWGESLLDR